MFSAFITIYVSLSSYRLHIKLLYR